MGLTKRKDSYYVEFQVLDDGKTLTLAPSVSGGETEAVEGRQPEPDFSQAARSLYSPSPNTPQLAAGSFIKTELMKGIVRSDQARSLTFKAWGALLTNRETRSAGRNRDAHPTRSRARLSVINLTLQDNTVITESADPSQIGQRRLVLVVSEVCAGGCCSR
jgi:hypothetical protein